jgi:hypothetical protein
LLGQRERAHLRAEEDGALAGAFIQKRDECAEGGDRGNDVDSEFLFEHNEITTKPKAGESSALDSISERTTTTTNKQTTETLTSSRRTVRSSADRHPHSR